MMLLAAGILTWMIFWMQTQGRRLQTELAAGIQQAAVAGQGWALFSLAFLAVLREGIEAALFLTAVALTAGASATFLGGLLGLLSAALLGWALYAATLRLDIRRFFTLTGLLLLFFAAGLVTHGLHEFIELGWLPGLIQHVWSTSRILPEASSFGQVLKALVGYNDSPSLTEALSYFAYIALITLALLRRGSPVRGPKPGTLA
jgi:high-affinity iron transporter